MRDRTGGGGASQLAGAPRGAPRDPRPHLGLSCHTRRFCHRFTEHAFDISGSLPSFECPTAWETVLAVYKTVLQAALVECKSPRD